MENKSSCKANSFFIVAKKNSEIGLNLRCLDPKHQHLCKKAKRQYCKKCTHKTYSNNNQFWNLVQSFLTNKSSPLSVSITISDKDKFIDDEKKLIKSFDNYYINIVVKTSGKAAEKRFEKCDDNFEAVLKIIKKYEKHQSILENKKKPEFG